MANDTLYNMFSDAIKQGDENKVLNVTLDFSTIPYFSQNSEYFINLAYSNKQLSMAEIMIKNGAAFNIKSLFNINEFSCKQMQHLDIIKPHITDIQYKSAFNLIDAYGCNNQLDRIVLIESDFCIDQVKYMVNHTVSNVQNKLPISQYYNDLKNSSSTLMSEVINGVIGVSYNMFSPFVIMPVGTQTYFDSAAIKRSGQTNLIYLPIKGDYNDKKELSYTAHELPHFLFDTMPGFNGQPYFDEISRKSYEKATKATILNIFTMIFHRTVDDYNETVENEQVSIKFVGDFLAKNSPIDRFMHFNNPDDDYFIELSVRRYIDNSTMPTSNKKTLLDNYVKSFMEQKNISQDEAYVLARIGEFIKRPSHELYKELIVRMLELEVYGINSKTLEIFKPLKEYLEKYISPKIQEVIKVLPVPFCDAVQSHEVTSSGDVITAELPHHIETSGNTTPPAGDQDI